MLQADTLDELYRATRTPRLVHVPALTFLSLDGHGDPNTSPAYARAVQALYAMSYAAKFAVKKATGESFRVSPLEGLWWADDPAAFRDPRKADWDWTMLIRQPDSVTEDLVERLAPPIGVVKKLPVVADLRLVRLEEGAAAQVLHVGPYDAEGPTIERLHAFLRERGLTFDGLRHKHHEIYLGDPRRTAPERLRTIIRQPYSSS